MVSSMLRPASTAQQWTTSSSLLLRMPRPLRPLPWAIPFLTPAGIPAGCRLVACRRSLWASCCISWSTSSSASRWCHRPPRCWLSTGPAQALAPGCRMILLAGDDDRQSAPPAVTPPPAVAPTARCTIHDSPPAQCPASTRHHHARHAHSRPAACTDADCSKCTVRKQLPRAVPLECSQCSSASMAPPSASCMLQQRVQRFADGGATRWQRACRQQALRHFHSAASQPITLCTTIALCNEGLRGESACRCWVTAAR